MPDGKIEDEINKSKDEVIKLEPKVSLADISFVIETLSALGYRVGESSDELDLQTRRALLQFQLDSGLEKTGTLNEPTKIALISSGLRAQAKGDEADVERLMAIDQERLAALERNNLAGKGGVKTSSDCDECPDMILIDGGNLSTTITAKGPKYADVVNFDIGQFSVSQTEVTNQQFLAFATDQGIEAKFFNRSCYMWNQSTPPSMVATKTDADFYLENPNDPASCISLKEARDYVSWLSEKTSTVGKYRLPTEIEFEYLLTAGNAGRTPCKDFNGADASTKFTWRYDDCADLYPRKAPVARFSPNDFGVYDLFGNLWEWTSSCWVEDISNSNCESSKIYTVRGASFDDSPDKFKPKSRQPVPISRLQQNIGFRVVKEVQ